MRFPPSDGVLLASPNESDAQPVEAWAPREVIVPAESVPEQLHASARTWPRRVAVDFLRRTTTYRDLERRVLRAAQGLLDLGVRAGDRVAIVMPNCTSHVVAFYAALRVGAVVVEHNPTYPASQLAHQLADSGALVAIAWEPSVPAALAAREGSALRTVVAVDLTADLPRSSRLMLSLPLRAARRARATMRGPVPRAAVRWESVLEAPELPESHPFPGADDVAILQYTGGTTGTPKGAVLTHRNLLANAVQCEEWTRMGRGEQTMVGALPFFHAFGLQTLLVLGIRTASTLVPFPRFDPEAIVASQRRRPATFFPAVPPMLERTVRVAAAKGVDLTSFSFAFSGAMPLPAQTAREWESATGGYAIEGYGMTETGPVALGNPVSPARRPGSLGLPFPSTQIRVVDPETLDDVSDGTRGELLVRGPQVFRGYWNRPEESAAQLLEDGWLRTGDIVVRDETGFVTLVDRIKEMIVTGGFKVYPSQVEDHLREMPGVADVAVVGMPAGDIGEKVVAAVVLDGTVPEISLADLRAWAAQHLTGYALPKELHVVSELPRSLIGKVLRRSVKEGLLAGTADDAGRADADGAGGEGADGAGDPAWATTDATAS
ncbi:MAG: long-chain fatty acid--CoA ligase [Micrococcales bacterium 73-15]|uniref:AMP-binding protein n=1 Tax=Salana multivorans TaxID=120377 RepID=UPI0009633D80|nr:AMP-binding protein [Salana multivorans]OJX96063.1 MAG: long-chain fatty acid--CoA ligase [Micrococcales bacterium 73-15]